MGLQVHCSAVYHEADRYGMIPFHLSRKIIILRIMWRIIRCITATKSMLSTLELIVLFNFDGSIAECRVAL